MHITRFGLLIVVLASCLTTIHSAAADQQYKTVVTVKNANDVLEYHATYNVANQKYTISHAYIWKNDIPGRFSLESYSIDNGPTIQITRHQEGNFTLEIFSDADHAITFFARQQFEFISTEGNVTFVPASPTMDSWFDKNSEVQFTVPYVKQLHDGTRQQLSGWSMDNSDINIIPRQESGSFKSDAIQMSGNHIVSPEYKKQYHVSVISNFGRALGTGWYDAGTIATVSVMPGEDAIIEHKFSGWQGQVIGNGDQYSASILVDSPKTLVARWFIDYTNISIISIIAIGILVSLVIYQKRKMPAKV